MSCIYSQTDEDDELRKKTAERWSSKDFPIKPEDINCDGCISETVIPFCEECNVRKCGLEKGVKNCAYCTEYPCEKLEKLWNSFQVPQAKEILDEIRKTI